MGCVAGAIEVVPQDTLDLVQTVMDADEFTFTHETITSMIDTALEEALAPDEIPSYDSACKAAWDDFEDMPTTVCGFDIVAQTLDDIDAGKDAKEAVFTNSKQAVTEGLKKIFKGY